MPVRQVPTEREDLLKRTIFVENVIMDPNGHVEVNYRIEPAGGTAVIVYDSKQEFLDECTDPIGSNYDLGVKIAVAAWLGIDPLAEQPELLTSVATEVDFTDLTIVRRVLI